jgi:hypothetical protein
MPRKRLTLEDLVERGTFDASNFRHRRCLDESGPLDDPELEDARLLVLRLRGVGGAKVRAAETLQEFARLVERRSAPKGATPALSTTVSKTSVPL